jgi:hypothetical protein
VLELLHIETLEYLTMKYYAHSLEGQSPDKWQPLEEHLENAAEMAAWFARQFGGYQWA